MVRPRPTSAAVRPTIWVKKTADPVMKVPSPRAKSSDWRDSPPATVAREVLVRWAKRVLAQ